MKVLMILATALLIPACEAPPLPPSDESVIKQFTTHRGEFELLLKMFREDRIYGRFSCDNPAPGEPDTSGISKERRGEYAKILRAVGSACVADLGNERVKIVMWSVGMLFAGQDKSIMYSPILAPYPLVKTTDNYQWTEEDHRRGAVNLCRAIERDWYLQYIAN